MISSVRGWKPSAWPAITPSGLFQTQIHNVSLHQQQGLREKRVPFVYDADVHTSLNERVRGHYAGGSCPNDEDVNVAFLDDGMRHFDKLIPAKLGGQCGRNHSPRSSFLNSTHRDCIVADGLIVHMWPQFLSSFFK